MPHRGHHYLFTYTLLAAVVGGSFLLSISTVLAFSTQRANELQVGDNAAQRVTLFDGKFKGGATVAAADVNGDGQDEYVVGAGATGGSQVQIFDQSLALQSQFFAYISQMKDGVNVAAGDLDGDGVAEIVVGPQAGTLPKIKVFNREGQKLREFLAFEANFAGGVEVAVLPAREGQPGHIFVSSGFGRESEIRMYDASGATVEITWSPFGKESSNGASIAAGWSGTYNEPVLVVGPGEGEKPLVQVYGINSRNKLANWFAYRESVKTGLSVAYRNDVVITSPGIGGGPDVRMFTVDGGERHSAIVFEKDFRGGVNVAAAVVNGVVTPIAVPTRASGTAAGEGKKIVISLSKQEMTLYEKGRIVSVRRVSTGKWSTPTPTGTFAIKNKIPVAYSKAYGLYMENWMAFSPDGRYGLHSLPYWRLKGGRKLYEGAAHIGTPVSHGCIRQTLAESKTLYDWAPIGTPVIVTK